MRPSKREGGNLMYYFWVKSLFYKVKEFLLHHKFQLAHDPLCLLANDFLMDIRSR